MMFFHGFLECPCRSEGDRFNEIISPYDDRIIVRRPDPQVFLETKSEQPRTQYGRVSKVRRHRKYHWQNEKYQLFIGNK